MKVSGVITVVDGCILSDLRLVLCSLGVEGSKMYRKIITWEGAL